MPFGQRLSNVTIMTKKSGQHFGGFYSLKESMHKGWELSIATGHKTNDLEEGGLHDESQNKFL